MKPYLDAGKAVALHGLKGELKIELWGDDVKAIKQAGRVFFSPQGGESCVVKGVRPQGNMALLSLQDVETPEAARAYVGRVLYLAREDIKLPKGHYFLADLFGCRVVDADTGREYGTIADVTHPGAQDIYTIKAADGQVYYLPAVPAFVKERRPEEGLVLVTPIPGLFGAAENADEEDQS